MKPEVAYVKEGKVESRLDQIVGKSAWEVAWIDFKDITRAEQYRLGLKADIPDDKHTEYLHTCLRNGDVLPAFVVIKVTIQGNVKYALLQGNHRLPAWMKFGYAGYWAYVLNKDPMAWADKRFSTQDLAASLNVLDTSRVIKENEYMELALDAVETGRLSSENAAKEYGCVKSTLESKLRHRKKAKQLQSIGVSRGVTEDLSWGAMTAVKATVLKHIPEEVSVAFFNPISKLPGDQQVSLIREFMDSSDHTKVVNKAKKAAELSKKRPPIKVGTHIRRPARKPLILAADRCLHTFEEAIEAASSFKVMLNGAKLGQDVARAERIKDQAEELCLLTKALASEVL